ncbi:hypothetical protein QET93_005030 [Akkermansia sp. N21116]|uniref:hypothetical protein n=2 Tax=unclassified Akkermansia TaxID=2608915 RepID=UPI00244E62D7|nr:hypothetical protein [Akkermansia sp. N21116]WPX41468.1 hypothetical protein QET93_005030 [Akkermansia sp. N21116]
MQSSLVQGILAIDMTTEGWITMIFSIGGVLTLATWCFSKVLSQPKPEDDLSRIELQTPDMDNDSDSRNNAGNYEI